MYKQKNADKPHLKAATKANGHDHNYASLMILPL